jgi:hypothetical protein
MNPLDAESFAELELNKDYIVELKEMPGPQHIRILYKGEYVCLIEIIDPNHEEGVKKWCNYGDDEYGDERGLYAVYEELTGYTRGKKIDNLLEDDEK